VDWPITIASFLSYFHLPIPREQIRALLRDPFFGGFKEGFSLQNHPTPE